VRTLEPGAVVAFPRGADGAHRVWNRSDQRVRLLIASTMNFPEIAEYPDAGATLTMTAAREGKAFGEGSDTPYPEVLMQAMRAASEQSD
jgi:uncharacterized cupin superfamily protein